MREINIGDILKSSVDTYKENWKTLVIITFMSTLISVVANTTISTILSNQTLNWNLMYTVVMWFIRGIGFYFTSRLSVTLIISTVNAISKEKVEIAKNYEAAKKTIWRYMGITILLTLILFIPNTLMTLGLYNVKAMEISVPIRIIMFFVGIIPTFYLSTTFGFANCIAVLKSKETKAFSYSKQLVSGNFIKVLSIKLIPIILTFPIYILNYYLSVNGGSFSGEIFYTFISSLFNIMVAPFGMLLYLNTFRCLDEVEESMALQKSVEM